MSDSDVYLPSASSTGNELAGDVWIWYIVLY